VVDWRQRSFDTFAKDILTYLVKTRELT